MKSSTPNQFTSIQEEIDYYKDQVKELERNELDSKRKIEELLKQVDDLKSKQKDFNYLKDENKKLKSQSIELQEELETTKQSWRSDVKQRYVEAAYLKKRNDDLEACVATISNQLENEKSLLSSISVCCINSSFTSKL